MSAAHRAARPGDIRTSSYRPDVAGRAPSATRATLARGSSTALRLVTIPSDEPRKQTCASARCASSGDVLVRDPGSGRDAVHLL